MEFCKKILMLRRQFNLSQEELAEKLGLSRQAIQKWESGESIPDVQNLIALSSIFCVSLDRLLKEEACSDVLTASDESKKWLEFLVRAKKKTYAGNGKELEKHSRPNSHDFFYQEDEFKYMDTYFGGKSFIGEEALFYKEKPIWGMNYKGVEISDEFSGDFLKAALAKVSMEMPYRGPHIYQVGDYLYICSVDGNYQCFHGKEEIYCQQKLVYECYFHGGEIR